MAEVHPWRPNETCDLVIHHLVEGKCIVLPTETTYEIVASALHPVSVACVSLAASGRRAPSIVLRDFASISDWLPLLRGAGRRIFRKLGAGPISLTADGGYRFGLFSKLAPFVRSIIDPFGEIRVRWPAHPIWEELHVAGIPLVSVPLDKAHTVKYAVEMAGDVMSCLIDAGPTQFEAGTSWVRAEGRRCRVVTEGALSADDIDELARCRIVFICTGNTCRSPMAEVLCAKLLADHLGCAPGELKQHGFDIQSAGLAAMPGGQASPDAVRVVAEHGADLSAHRSRPATMDLLVWADHVFTMTASHAHALEPLTQIPPPRLLSPNGDDVDDPIGGELADYRHCADQIIQYLKERLPELLES